MSTNRIVLAASPTNDVRIFVYGDPFSQIDVSPDDADALALQLAHEAERCRVLHARGVDRDNAGI